MIVCKSERRKPAGELVPPVVEDDSEVALELATAGVVVGVWGAAGVETFEEERLEEAVPPAPTEPSNEASPAGPPRPRTLPSIDISCCVDISGLLNKLRNSSSGFKERSEGESILWPPPPPPRAAGGLFMYSLIFVTYSSSLSSLGSCDQKKRRRGEVLNFRTKTRPVVHWGTRKNSASSGKMMRSYKKENINRDDLRLNENLHLRPDH